MHLHSLSEAGEGSWEKRGAQALCTLAAIGLSLLCIKVQSKEKSHGPKSQVDGVAGPCGGGVSPQSPLAGRQLSPAPSIQDSGSWRRVLEGLGVSS